MKYSQEHAIIEALQQHYTNMYHLFMYMYSASRFDEGMFPLQ